jgi:hypothetical protein
LAGCIAAAASSCWTGAAQDARAALAVAEFACAALPQARDRELCFASQKLTEAIADCIDARNGSVDAGVDADAAPHPAPGADAVCTSAHDVAVSISVKIRTE